MQHRKPKLPKRNRRSPTNPMRWRRIRRMRPPPKLPDITLPEVGPGLADNPVALGSAASAIGEAPKPTTKPQPEKTDPGKAPPPKEVKKLYSEASTGDLGAMLAMAGVSRGQRMSQLCASELRSNCGVPASGMWRSTCRCSQRSRHCRGAAWIRKSRHPLRAGSGTYVGFRCEGGCRRHARDLLCQFGGGAGAAQRMAATSASSMD